MIHEHLVQHLLDVGVHLVEGEELRVDALTLTDRDDAVAPQTVDGRAFTDLSIGHDGFPWVFHYLKGEVFFTGTAAEVIPVVKLDSRVIGDGKPGAITRDLMGRFKQLTRG